MSDDWNTSWNEGDMPDNTTPNEIPKQESPPPRMPVPIGRSFPVNGEGFNQVVHKPIVNKERFRYKKKECRWGPDCRQAQICKHGLGNDKDEDHLRFFSHPDEINDPPFTACKNGDECWAVLTKEKALEEKEEVPFEAQRHCFFFHRSEGST